MKAVKNTELLNSIRKEASTEYQERVPVVKTEADAKQVERILNDYPTAKNEFINTLVNQVVKKEFFSKIYSNPLKELKKGMLPFGTSIAQLFVKQATAKGFVTDKDNAAALVGKKEVKVEIMYIERNFQYVYETSISEEELKGAFMNQEGLSELVNQIVGSLESGAEQKEYKDMINILVAAAKGNYITMQNSGITNDTNKIDANKGVKAHMKQIAIGDAKANPKLLAEAIRATAGNMKFIRNDYNMAGVDTFSRKEDLVFLTTPEMVAKLDVNVLATAFNVSATDVPTKIIEVDQLPQTMAKANEGIGTAGTGTVECYGILMDRAFIQAIDTVNTSKQFENGRALMTNLFLHRQGVLATCYFANCVAFVKTVAA